MSISKQVVLAIRLIFILSILIAPFRVGHAEEIPDGPIPESTLPDTDELVVSRGGEGLCSTMLWKATNTIKNGIFSTYSKHVSTSRDYNNTSYPCDIDLIGARGRMWVFGVLDDDTGMQTSPNSADKTVQTNGTDITCGGNDIYSRGNHKFEENGLNPWNPQVDKSC
ncbi:MAG: hypothetical protein Fur0022_43700 [Anaerolineales bacterium]